MGSASRKSSANIHSDLLPTKWWAKRDKTPPLSSVGSLTRKRDGCTSGCNLRWWCSVTGVCKVGADSWARCWRITQLGRWREKQIRTEEMLSRDMRWPENAWPVGIPRGRFNVPSKWNVDGFVSLCSFFHPWLVGEASIWSRIKRIKTQCCIYSCWAQTSCARLLCASRAPHHD